MTQPETPPSEPEPTLEPEPAPEVVFVDDDPAVRGIIAYDFPSWCVLGSGAAALQELQRLRDAGTPAAVLVTDQRMHPMGGIELCSKAKVLSPDTARIMLTAYHDCSAMDATNVAELHRIVVKPYRRTELAAEVERFLKRKRVSSQPKLPCITDAQIYGQQARDRLLKTSTTPRRDSVP